MCTTTCFRHPVRLANNGLTLSVAPIWGFIHDKPRHALNTAPMLEATIRQRRIEFRNAENPSPIIAVIFQAVAYAYVLPDRLEFHLFRLSLHHDEEENVGRKIEEKALQLIMRPGYFFDYYFLLV